MLEFDKSRTADNELVSLVCKGNPEAIAKFYCDSLVPITTAVLRRLAAREIEPEELANDAFLHLCEDDWRRLRTFSGKSLPGWLWRVCYRIFLEKVKDSSRTLPLSDQPESKFAEEYPILDFLAQKQAWAQVLDAIEQLKPRDGFVLRSIYVDDKDLDEIASELNITIGALFVVATRARKRLRSILRGEAPDEDSPRT